MGAPLSRGRVRVVGAFASERDARYAVELIGASLDRTASFRLWPIVGEHGETQMILLEIAASIEYPVARIELLVVGAHGVVMPTMVMPA
jgi:hypothetical protein